jgi:peroxiredoxin
MQINTAARGDGHLATSKPARVQRMGPPKTFVIGRDGRICRTHVGLSVKEHFEQQIKSLL